MSSPAPAAPTEAPRLGPQPILTTHRIFEAFDEEKKSLGIIHGDLFDSRPEVVLSALRAVGRLGDPRSFPYVARRLDTASEEILAAAVRAMGSLGHPDAPRLLRDLDRTSRTEQLRREILAALAAAAPGDEDVVAAIRSAVRAPMVSAGSRAHAAGLLLRIGGEAALEELLADAHEEVLDKVIGSASENPSFVPRVMAHCAPLYPRLPARNRASLAALAAARQLPESAAVVRGALADPNAEVRRAVYTALGTAPHQSAWLSGIVPQMAASVESNPAIEDEAQAAITRMAKLPDARAAIPPGIRAAVFSKVAELYKQLGASGRKVASDTHELGWLITRSREYLEYYGDEELKAALLRWLKGASSDTADGLLKMLKATAVRVEVRHFDGYAALVDLIKNPRRAGIALVARELALARTGKARVLWRLGRVIRLSAIFLAPGGAASVAALLKSIYTRAKQEKLFRLAEAALIALARVDVPSAEAACRECLTLPLSSKVLAIASLHLLRELNTALLEPAATRLLASQDDPYVTMNALEAISGGPPSSNGELARALLTRLSMDCTPEVRNALTTFLGDKVAVDITESLKEHMLSGDEPRRSSALAVLERRIGAGLVSNRDGTVEFLYRVLRGEHEPSRRSAALMLWTLADDYAAEVLRDFLTSGRDDSTVDVLRRLPGTPREPLLSGLAPLFQRESQAVQEGLRDFLLRAEEPAPRQRVLEMTVAARADAPSDEREGEEEPPDSGQAVEARSERSAFQFERENMEELVMFFSDIQGYSKKAQVLSPMQLAALLQEYEKVLLAHVEAHRGELVKRMGDGHMIVFRSALQAVLAAIRLQKSLRRFNRYRDETNRVVIRIGIHGGKVVRKEGGDVLGNAVNIASRLESSARPGSILISDRVEADVRDFVHVREIGHITVKNIAEPIKVFEPFEIVLDLPTEADPLRSGSAAGRKRAGAAAGVASPAGTSGGAAEDRIVLEPDVYAEIQRCFSALAGVCRQAPSGQVQVVTLYQQVLARWERLRPRLPALSRKA